MGAAHLLASCMAFAAAHYHVPVQKLRNAVTYTQEHPAADRIGVSGIPSDWLPVLSHYGFDARRVRTDACVNVEAGAWIFAFDHQRRQALHAWASRQSGVAKRKALSERAAKWQPAVRWVCAQAGVNPALVDAVIEQESGFDEKAVSSAGAIGLMQILPQNAKAWHVDARDGLQNIWAGTWYLRYLIEQYHGDVTLALAAYNSGQANVARYRGIPPFKETQNYVPAVIRKFYKFAGYQPVAYQVPR